MTGIDGYDWASVGWSNPVPGDPDVVRGIAGQVQGLAADVGLQNRLVQSVGDEASGVWEGPAANVFHPKLGKLPPELDKLVTSYHDAADALNTFWPRHRAAQELAVQALGKAQTAKTSIAHAQVQVAACQSQANSAAGAYNTAANPPAGMPPPSTPAAKVQAATTTGNLLTQYRLSQSKLGDANTALSGGQGDMRAAEAMRDQAVGDFGRAAGTFASMMATASRAGIHNVHHSWWQSALDDVGSVAGDLFHQTAQFASGVYDPVVMLAKLADPLTAPQELDQLAKGLAYGVTHPLAFGKALLDWKDLSSGNIAHWLGNLTPAIVGAVFTGGASEVADGAEGLTALERAGMSADDVAGLAATGNQDAAARIIMRGDDPVPGSISDGGVPQTSRAELASNLSPEAQIAREGSNFVGEPSASDLAPGTWGANVHDSSVPLFGDEGGGRSLQWLVRPTDLLSMDSTGEYESRLALLPEWTSGVRDETTVVQAGAGDGPMWEGAAARQASEQVPGLTLPGGGNRILVNHLSGASAVWTGPLPWTTVPDPTMVLRGMGKLAGAAGGIGGARVLAGSSG